MDLEGRCGLHMESDSGCALWCCVGAIAVAWGSGGPHAGLTYRTTVAKLRCERMAWTCRGSVMKAMMRMGAAHCSLSSRRRSE